MRPRHVDGMSKALLLPRRVLRPGVLAFPGRRACIAHIMLVRLGGTRIECSACGKKSTQHKLAARRASFAPTAVIT